MRSKNTVMMVVMFLLCAPAVLAQDNPNVPGGPVVVNRQTCSILSSALVTTQAYYCSPFGGWEKTSTDVLVQSRRPDAWGRLKTGEIADGCCEPGKCWAGSEETGQGGCVANQTLLSHWKGTVALPAPANHYRCIDGQWREPTLKTTPDNAQNGFCPETASVKRCLLKPSESLTSTNTKNMDRPEGAYGCAPSAGFGFCSGEAPSCIRQDQYVDDYLCGADGNWTSRTKLLALNMLSIAQSAFPGRAYSLFCDKAENILDDPVPLARQGECAIDGVKVPCYNNFCMLRVAGMVVLGASLNTPLEGEASFAKVIDKDAGGTRITDEVCAGVDSPGFQPCRPGIYYNRQFNMVLYVPSTSGLPSPDASGLAAINAGVLAQKNDIVRKASEITSGAEGRTVDFSFFDKRNSMGIIYAAESGNTRLFGVIESDVAEKPGVNGTRTGSKWDFIGVQYRNPSSTLDICRFIHTKDSSAVCKKEVVGGADEVVMGQLRSTGVTGDSTIIAAWRDLTAKLRP